MPGGNRTTDPVISRPADERLVLFPPELSGALSLKFRLGFRAKVPRFSRGNRPPDP